MIIKKELAQAALEIIHTAYSSAEWMRQFRSEQTDRTQKELEDALRVHCPVCDSTNVVPVEGEFETGVTAPDGGKEYRYEQGIHCMNCGITEVG